MSSESILSQVHVEGGEIHDLSLLVASTNIGGYFLTLCFKKSPDTGHVSMMTCTRLKKILDSDTVQTSNMIKYEDLSFILFTRDGKVYSIYGGV